MNLRGPETDFGLGAFSFRQIFFLIDLVAGKTVILSMISACPLMFGLMRFAFAQWQNDKLHPQVKTEQQMDRQPKADQRYSFNRFDVVHAPE